MTEDRDDKDENQEEEDQTESAKATVHGSWWPGWIWAIPIAVLGIGVWLGVRALTGGGADIVIAFVDVHGVKQNDTDILYRGMSVGSVKGVNLSKNGDAVEVKANIDSSASKFLTTGTRFWLRQADLSDPSTLGAILSGPKIVMAPGPGRKSNRFVGLEHKPIAPAANANSVAYEVVFDGDAGALDAGDPVKLRGFDVGEVREVGFRFDAKRDKLSVPVTLELYPALFHVAPGANGDRRAAFEAEMNALIAHGLHAELDREPPLLGSYQVTLEIVPSAHRSARAALSAASAARQIPAAGGGGINSLVTRLSRVPIDKIAQNILDITRHVDAIASSRALNDSVKQLDVSLRQIHQTVSHAGPQITQLVKTLRSTANELDQVAAGAQRVVGGPSSQTGLNTATEEISEAARSVRDLADYLDRHPEALIKGRTGADQ